MLVSIGQAMGATDLTSFGDASGRDRPAARAWPSRRSPAGAAAVGAAAVSRPGRVRQPNPGGTGMSRVRIGTADADASPCWRRPAAARTTRRARADRARRAPRATGPPGRPAPRGPPARGTTAPARRADRHRGAGGSTGGSGRRAGDGGVADAFTGTPDARAAPYAAACASTVRNKGACMTATDVQCANTCGPNKSGYKNCDCYSDVWDCPRCEYVPGDYSCYRLPDPLEACPMVEPNGRGHRFPAHGRHRPARGAACSPCGSATAISYHRLRRRVQGRLLRLRQRPEVDLRQHHRMAAVRSFSSA